MDLKYAEGKKADRVPAWLSRLSIGLSLSSRLDFKVMN